MLANLGMIFPSVLVRDLVFHPFSHTRVQGIRTLRGFKSTTGLGNAGLNSLRPAAPPAPRPHHPHLLRLVGLQTSQAYYTATFPLYLRLRTLPSSPVWKMDWQKPSNPLTRKTYFRTITQCTEASNHNPLGKLPSIISEPLILPTIVILWEFFIRGNKTHSKLLCIYLSHKELKSSKDCICFTEPFWECILEEKGYCQDQQTINQDVKVSSLPISRMHRNSPLKSLVQN